MQMAPPTVPRPGGTAVEADPGEHAHDGYGPSGRSRWLDVDWREHQRWVSVDGQPVNTIEIGEGPPLVFVHGLSGSWPNWLEQLPVFAGGAPGSGRPSTIGGAPRHGDGPEPWNTPAPENAPEPWDRPERGGNRAPEPGDTIEPGDAPALGRYRVIAMDLPGFGHSPMPRERITISGYARLIDGLLEEFGIGAAAVVGHSMGGFVSAELAIAFPQRVERLVLVSPAGLSTYRNPRATRALPALRRTEPIAAAYSARLAPRSAMIKRPRLRDATFGLVTLHPGRLPAALVTEQLLGAGKPGFVQALEAILDYDFRDRLPEIACPTLVVWGDRDRVVTVRDAAVYTELIPGSRRVVYEDTGHLAMLERPGAFNALLGDFLEE